MRHEPTEAERLLWKLLRNKRLAGWKFKRQQPIGRYIADFVCFGARLIVEADGAHHLGNDHDKRRDAWLSSQGFRMLCFWNNDILGGSEAVLTAILAALDAASSRAERFPSPQPSPARGEGEVYGVSCD